MIEQDTFTKIGQNVTQTECRAPGSIIYSSTLKTFQTPTPYWARPRRTDPHARHHIDTLCNPPSRRYGLSHVYRDAPCFADPETLLHSQALAWATVGSVASSLVSPDARAPFFPHRFARNSNIVHSSLSVAFCGHHLTLFYLSNIHQTSILT